MRSFTCHSLLHVTLEFSIFVHKMFLFFFILKLGMLMVCFCG